MTTNRRILIEDHSTPREWVIDIAYNDDADFIAAIDWLNKLIGRDTDPSIAEHVEEPALRGLPVITEEPTAEYTVILDREEILVRNDADRGERAWRSSNGKLYWFYELLDPIRLVYAPTPTLTDMGPATSAQTEYPVLTEEPLTLDTVVLDRDGIPWIRTDDLPEIDAWHHPRLGRRHFIYLAHPVRMLHDPTLNA
jgi:hypothetical protein